MTRDEIISLAREAGIDRIHHDDDHFEEWRCCTHELSRFAALVVAAEREACAKLCEQSDRYRGRFFAQSIRERGAA